MTYIDTDTAVLLFGAVLSYQLVRLESVARQLAKLNRKVDRVGLKTGAMGPDDL